MEPAAAGRTVGGAGGGAPGTVRRLSAGSILRLRAIPGRRTHRAAGPEASSVLQQYRPCHFLRNGWSAAVSGSGRVRMAVSDPHSKCGAHGAVFLAVCPGRSVRPRLPGATAGGMDGVRGHGGVGLRQALCQCGVCIRAAGAGSVPCAGAVVPCTFARGPSCVRGDDLRAYGSARRPARPGEGDGACPAVYSVRRSRRLGWSLCASAGCRPLAPRRALAPRLFCRKSRSVGLRLRAGFSACPAAVRRTAADLAGPFGGFCRSWEKSNGFFRDAAV